MPQQPELTSHPLPATPASRPGNPTPAPASAPALQTPDLFAQQRIADQPGSNLPGPDQRGANQPGPDQPLPAKHPAHQTTQRIPPWLESAELFLRVLLSMYIGLAVCLAPWFRIFWDQNLIILHFPLLAAFAAKGAVRGLVSGLGLLNLWIAFHDAIRHGAEKP